MITEYRDLLNRIQTNYTRLSKGQKIIADYIFENYDKVAFMTAATLGKSVNVSESTVVRFADALGYDGYPNLQRALQESIKTKLTTVQRFELSQDLDTEEHLIKRVMHSDIDNIRKSIDTLDARTVQEAVQDINAARKVYIIGLRSSKVLAEYLAFYLNFIIQDVHLIPYGANDAFDQLIHLSSEDLLIAISFPRYSQRTFEVVEYAKQKGTKIIAITDSITAPLAPFAHYTLTAKYNMTTFIDSLVAPMSLINALIIALSMTKKDQLKENFDVLERIWAENQIYSKK